MKDSKSTNLYDDQVNFKYVVTNEPTRDELDQLENEYISGYNDLLNTFPLGSLGYGLDPYAGYSHQAMTYGLILSSEVTRYKKHETDEGTKRIRESTMWLIENSIGAEGIPGWGISAAWDAFADGTKNPDDQTYTITAAIVIEGLLDALETDDIFSDNERNRIINTIQKIFDYYLINAWTNIDKESGYFWYSTNVNDQYFTPNVSSAFLGVLARYFSEYGDILKNKDFYYGRLNAAVKAIIDNVQYIDEKPFWEYVPKSHMINMKRPNDLVHHAYIIKGIEAYREYINQVEIPWSVEKSIESLNDFWKGDTLFYFPQNSIYSGVLEQFNTRPANLWGGGTILGTYEILGDAKGAERAVKYIASQHGEWDKLTMYPLEYLNDEKYYPRHSAHVLWGLSKYIWKEVD